MAKAVSFPEVWEKLQQPNTIILDVREPAELRTDGMISGARNVPIAHFATAFGLKDQDFQNTYGFLKPKPADDIVVHCKAGGRAESAAKFLVDLGYSNVAVYSGIKDWVKNGGKVEKKLQQHILDTRMYSF